MILRLSAVFVSALCLSGIAGAQGTLPSIYVDVGSGTLGAFPPSNSFSAAAAAPGAWNLIDVDLMTTPVYVTPPLLDTSGAPTGVTIEWDGQGTNIINFEFDEPNTFGDDEILLDDVGYNAGPSTMSVRGLPAGTYDVLTYSMAPDNAAYLTNISVPGSVDPPQDVGGDFALGYALGVTHAKHTVVVAAGADLVIELDVASQFDSVNGLQIFESVASTIGTSYCGPAVTNSTGGPAELSITGSATAALNDVTLTCGSMPTNAFGFFLVSRTQGFTPNPGGSQGNLCLGGAIGRYVGPGQIQNSGTSGEIGLALDLTMIPTPTGFVSAQTGDTFNFTTWFRDAIGGAATSNFSQGVELTFL